MRKIEELTEYSQRLKVQKAISILMLRYYNNGTVNTENVKHSNLSKVISVACYNKF